MVDNAINANFAGAWRLKSDSIQSICASPDRRDNDDRRWAHDSFAEEGRNGRHNKQNAGERALAPT
jgi:hypothetical protein